MSALSKSADLFEAMGGIDREWPRFPGKGVFHTPGAGTPYLIGPGVALLAKPTFNIHALDEFLVGFDGELEFDEYCDDDDLMTEHSQYADGTGLIKTCGQLCYMSFGPGRTRNAEAGKYVDNLKSSGHGSVMEHPQYTWLVWGADRSFTHEAVRHRTGVAFSQVSQRYVDGKVLRFVERPEYQGDSVLHDMFCERIDRAGAEYEKIAKHLMEKQLAGDPTLAGAKKTNLRKKINQAARSCLPNEAEAPIAISGNIRALRHICEMRASGAADVPIREVTNRIFLGMRELEPLLFSDYELEELPDGTLAVSTKWRKV